MRSERSYSGLAPVAAGCTSRGSREEGIASLAFAGSLTAAPSFVRELLDAFSRAQPVPSTASITKALRPIVRRVLFIVLSSSAKPRVRRSARRRPATHVDGRTACDLKGWQQRCQGERRREQAADGHHALVASVADQHEKAPNPYVAQEWTPR